MRIGLRRIGIGSRRLAGGAVNNDRVGSGALTMGLSIAGTSGIDIVGSGSFTTGSNRTGTGALSLLLDTSGAGTVGSGAFYGPENFASATTEDLHTFDANWVSTYTQGDALQVVASVDYVDQHIVSGGRVCYTYQGTGVSTTDQKIQADMYTNSGSQTCSLVVRQQSASANGLIVTFNGATGAVVLYHVFGGGVVHTFAATIAAATVTTCTVEIVGSTLTVTVGAQAPESVTDSTYATGYPGIATTVITTPYDGARITNVSIWNS